MKRDSQYHTSGHAGFKPIEKEEAKTVDGKTAEDVEEIASKVHDAWWEEKESNGFHSPNDCQSKNKESYSKSSWQNQDRFDTHFDSKTYKWCDKCHPDMYPYNELTENAKEYDRTTVTTVLKAMQAYSAQQNTALLTRTSLLESLIAELVDGKNEMREGLEQIKTLCEKPLYANWVINIEKIQAIVVEAIKPKQ